MNDEAWTPAESDSAASSPDRVFRAILEGLYQGRYVPGQRLVEADLTRAFKVSRGSVREALNRLAAEGVIALSRHRGAHIHMLSRSEAREVLAVVEVIIGLAARLAAQNARSGENRAQVEAALERVRASQRRPDFLDFVKARNGFYRALVKVGGNRELARVLPGMQVHLLRTQFRGYGTASDDMKGDDYERIARAVLAGEPKRAEAEAHRHVRRLRQSIDRLPDAAFATEG